MKKKNVNYKQCALKRDNSHHTAWIPENFATKGKFIKIKKSDDLWEDGWEVMSVSDGIKTSQEVISESQKHKKFGNSIK